MVNLTSKKPRANLFPVCAAACSLYIIHEEFAGGGRFNSCLVEFPVYNEVGTILLLIGVVDLSSTDRRAVEFIQKSVFEF